MSVAGGGALFSTGGNVAITSGFSNSTSGGNVAISTANAVSNMTISLKFY